MALTSETMDTVVYNRPNDLHVAQTVHEQEVFLVSSI